MALNKEELTLRASIAGHTAHAKHDSHLLTAPARAAFLNKFLDQVDPERILPEEERNRRAEHARKAYFSKLALQSARARRLATVTPSALLAAVDLLLEAQDAIA